MIKAKTNNMTPAMANATLTLTGEIETIIDSLINLLDLEVDAIKSADFKSFTALQNDKVALLTRYKALIETTQKQSSNLQTAPDTIKERLREAAQKLDASLQVNKAALEGGLSSMQRIMDRVVNAARETLNQSRTTYTKAGRTSGGTTLSITMDEVL